MTGRPGAHATGQRVRGPAHPAPSTGSRRRRPGRSGRRRRRRGVVHRRHGSLHGDLDDGAGPPRRATAGSSGDSVATTALDGATVHRGRRRGLAAGRAPLPRGGGGRRQRADRPRRHHPGRDLAAHGVDHHTRPPGRCAPRPAWPTRSTTPPRPPSARTTFVFGGGSPDTVATVQAVTAPGRPPTGRRHRHGGGPAAPAPVRPGRGHRDVRERGTGATTTAYLVGGYDGTTYLPGVLATTDGTHFTTVATLPVPVRYPAVVADGGMVYAFGGQTASPGSATTATDAIQTIDPATHRATVVGHLPQAALRRRGLPHRRDHLRGRGPGPRRSDPDPDQRLRARPRPGARTPGSSPRPTPSPATPPWDRARRRSGTWWVARWPPSRAPTRPAWPRDRSSR